MQRQLEERTSELAAARNEARAAANQVRWAELGGRAREGCLQVCLIEVEWVR